MFAPHSCGHQGGGSNLLLALRDDLGRRDLQQVAVAGRAHQRRVEISARRSKTRLACVRSFTQLYSDARFGWQYANISLLDRGGDGHDDEHPLVVLDHDRVSGSIGVYRADGSPVNPGKIFQAL
jgi:hypothetical protein